MSTSNIYCKIPVAKCGQKYKLVEEYSCCDIKSAKEKQQQQKRLHYLEDYKILRRGAWVFIFQV